MVVFLLVKFRLVTIVKGAVVMIYEATKMRACISHDIFHIWHRISIKNCI